MKTKTWETKKAENKTFKKKEKKIVFYILYQYMNIERFKDYTDTLDTNGLVELKKYIESQNNTWKWLLETMICKDKIEYINQKLHGTQLELQFTLEQTQECTENEQL